MPRLASIGFQAALGEYERGKLTGGQVAAIFSIAGDDAIEALALEARVVQPLESLSFGGYAQLTNIGATYDATNASAGLGLALIQTAGVTGGTFGLKVNKVGTGTQSWQLWNDTDSSEIAVIDDPGAAGVKALSATFSFPSALGAGLKTIRVRAKSTVAADDPHYFGATLLIRRVERMTAVELHEVLLLAESQVAGYDTAAVVRARLGL